MNLLDCEECAYDPVRHIIIDYINPYTRRLATSGTTVEEIRKDYPNAEIWNFDSAVMHYYDSFKTLPERITEKVFNERFECTSPLLWVNNGETESFRMSEFLAGSITGIYARINKDFFYFADEITLTHEQIINKIKAGS